MYFAVAFIARVKMKMIMPKSLNFFDITCNYNTVCIVSFVFSSSHYVNVSVLIKFPKKTSGFTLIIISSP